MKSYEIYTIFFLFYTVNQLHALECYVCEDQEDNTGKCATTVQPCNYDQDRCLSVVRWGSTPYWEIGAPMQYYISKQCADESLCQQKHAETVGLCQRIEWRDWSCLECCQGDRCNYYITLKDEEKQKERIANVEILQKDVEKQKERMANVEILQKDEEKQKERMANVEILQLAASSLSFSKITLWLSSLCVVVFARFI